MAESSQLRALANDVEIIGTLKHKELDFKSLDDGRQYIGGSLIVEAKFDDKVQNLRVNIFTMKKAARFYKGMETVNNEFKTIDEDGRENADRIRVIGNIELQEYYNSEGKLTQFNSIHANKIKRLKDEEQELEDSAYAKVETYIESIEDGKNADDIPTGELIVNGFTVNYGGRVVPLIDLKVLSSLAEDFRGLYEVGKTASLSIKLLNYPDITTAAEEKPVEHGFGQDVKVEHQTVQQFIQENDIVGGELPYFDERALTPEEVEEAHKLRNIALEDAKQRANTKKPAAKAQQGFANKPSEDNGVPRF
jgi:hypothetical protein